jgi:hypothetical protein
MLLANRLLRAVRGGEESTETDLRTVESVLAAAAKRLGEPAIPAVSRQLEASGVKWAWQMVHFSEADWDQLSWSVGLKTAAKAELSDPSISSISTSPPDSAQDLKAYEELTDRMRRFLLLPDANGREAKPLGSMSALFLGLLTTPVAERQSLLLALCELMALVSGLFLSTPFDLYTSPTVLPDSATASVWTVPPTLMDGMNSLVGFIFLIDFHVATFSVTMALYVAASGYRANDEFCESVMNILGVCFAFFFMGVFFPLLILCFWQFFHNSTSPYPMLVNFFIVLIFHSMVGGRTQRFLAGCLALELYHGPKWFMNMLRSASRGMGTTLLLEEKALKAAAERRAAKLREQICMQVIEPDTGASARAGASTEARTRRYLRAVAMS